MVDWLIDKWFLKPVLELMLWDRKSDRDCVIGMRHLAGSLQQPFQPIPGSLLHIVGFPLKRHLSNRPARLWHRRFRKQEPNDSVVMLTDFLDVPGTVLPVWGCDHYLKSSVSASVRVAEVLEFCQSAATRSSVQAQVEPLRGVV